MEGQIIFLGVNIYPNHPNSALPFHHLRSLKENEMTQSSTFRGLGVIKRQKQNILCQLGNNC
jgi:hypothetical protein